MSGGGSQTSTTVNKTELPEWVSEAGQSNYKKAVDLDNAPLQQYQGNRVAPLSGTMTSAIDTLKANQGQGTALTQQASGLFSGLTSLPTGYDKVNAGTINAGADVKAGMLADTDLSKYINPYTSEVIDKSLADLNDQRLKALMGNADAATKASAFGGSRQAINDAVTNAETAKSAGLLSSQLRADAFNNAQGAAMADIDRQLATDQYNRNTGITVQGQNVGNKLAADTANQSARQASQDATYRNQLAGAQGILSSGAQLSNQQLANFNALLGAGQLETSQGQKVIDADMAKFNEQRDKELNDLNTRLAALGMTPYPTTSTTTSTTPTQGPDWATAGLGALSLFMGLSDDDTKTDKMKLGTDPQSGLPLYAFRYKGDPKTYPKSIGVMASDVEKVKPEAVMKLPGGKRAVNYGMLSGAL